MASPYNLERELKVWCRKETDSEGDAITAMYLEEECLSYFGSWHNRDAKALGMPHITRKDVRVNKGKKGVVPMTIVFRAGHDDMKIIPLEMPDESKRIRTGTKEFDEFTNGIPVDRIWQLWGRRDND